MTFAGPGSSTPAVAPTAVTYSLAQPMALLYARSLMPWSHPNFKTPPSPKANQALLSATLGKQSPLN